MPRPFLNVDIFFPSVLTELSDEEQAHELKQEQEQEQDWEREREQEQEWEQEQEQVQEQEQEQDQNQEKEQDREWEREREQRQYRQHGSDVGRHSAAPDTGLGSKDTSDRNTASKGSQHQLFREGFRQPADGSSDEGAEDEWTEPSEENRHYYFKLSSTSDKPNRLVDRSLPFFAPPAPPL